MTHPVVPRQFVSSRTSPFQMSSLPAEVMIHVALHLNRQGAARLSLTCKAFSAAARPRVEHFRCVGIIDRMSRGAMLPTSAFAFLYSSRPMLHPDSVAQLTHTCAHRLKDVPIRELGFAIECFLEWNKSPTHGSMAASVMADLGAAIARAERAGLAPRQAPELLDALRLLSPSEQKEVQYVWRAHRISADADSDKACDEMVALFADIKAEPKGQQPDILLNVLAGLKPLLWKEDRSALVLYVTSAACGGKGQVIKALFDAMATELEQARPTLALRQLDQVVAVLLDALQSLPASEMFDCLKPLVCLLRTAKAPLDSRIATGVTDIFLAVAEETGNLLNVAGTLGALLWQAGACQSILQLAEARHEDKGQVLRVLLDAMGAELGQDMPFLSVKEVLHVGTVLLGNIAKLDDHQQVACLKSLVSLLCAPQVPVASWLSIAVAKACLASNDDSQWATLLKLLTRKVHALSNFGREDEQVIAALIDRFLKSEICKDALLNGFLLAAELETESLQTPAIQGLWKKADLLAAPDGDDLLGDLIHLSIRGNWKLAYLHDGVVERMRTWKNDLPPATLQRLVDRSVLSKRHGELSRKAFQLLAAYVAQADSALRKQEIVRHAALLLADGRQSRIELFDFASEYVSKGTEAGARDGWQLALPLLEAIASNMAHPSSRSPSVDFFEHMRKMAIAAPAQDGDRLIRALAASAGRVIASGSQIAEVDLLKLRTQCFVSLVNVAASGKGEARLRLLNEIVQKAFQMGAPLGRKALDAVLALTAVTSMSLADMASVMSRTRQPAVIEALFKQARNLSSNEKADFLQSMIDGLSRFTIELDWVAGFADLDSRFTRIDQIQKARTEAVQVLLRKVRKLKVDPGKKAKLLLQLAPHAARLSPALKDELIAAARELSDQLAEKVGVAMRVPRRG